MKKKKEELVPVIDVTSEPRSMSSFDISMANASFQRLLVEAKAELPKEVQDQILVSEYLSRCLTDYVMEHTKDLKVSEKKGRKKNVTKT